MLIDRGRVIRGAGDGEPICTTSREIYWRGFVYKPGCKAGAESLGPLCKVRESEIPEAAAELKGAYFVAVRCSDSANAYAFVDPGGLYHAYYSPRSIGTGFLELSQLEDCGPEDLDPAAVVEFFHFGGIFEERTFFPQIKRIDPDLVIRCSAAGRTERLPKPISDIGAEPEGTVESLLEEFVTAARNECVSVDLTGGADTRLLAVALSYFGLPFEMATSGWRGHEDAEIGAKVAEVLGRPHYPTYHSAEEIDWDELFSRSNGMFDVTKNSRLIQMQHDRKARGVTLAVSGAAGEFFRETWWLHDFPFYARKKARLGRLYSMRIATNGLQHSLLTGRYRLLSDSQDERFLQMLSKYEVPGNTRSYDRIYYFGPLRTLGGSFVTSSAGLVKMALPYADRDVFRIGYHMPRLERTFSRLHRRLITRYSPEAARLPTTEGGTSLETGAWAITRDLRRYLADRSMRLIKKFGQRALGKTFLQPSPDDPEVMNDLLRTLSARKSTQVLADHGVLSHALDPSSVPRRYAGRVFVLGRLLEQLDQMRGPAARSHQEHGQTQPSVEKIVALKQEGRRKRRASNTPAAL
jgi:hypothetical protein